jgi:hypothetical protein
MKQCTICHNWFEPQVPHQEYDRLSCRRKAERQRARLRDKGVVIQARTIGQTADHATLVSPTNEQLQHIAQVYVKNPTALPTHIFGVFDKEWTPPAGVVYISQAVMDGQQPFWMMTTQEYMDMKWKTAPTASEQFPVAGLPIEQIIAPPIVRRSPLEILNSILGEEKTK